MKDSSYFGDYIFYLCNCKYKLNNYLIKENLCHLSEKQKSILLYIVNEVILERKGEIFIKDIISVFGYRKSTIKKIFDFLEEKHLLVHFSGLGRTWFLQCGYIDTKTIDLNYYGDYNKILEERYTCILKDLYSLIKSVNKEHIINYINYVKLDDFEYEYLSHSLKYEELSCNEEEKKDTLKNGYYNYILVSIREKLTDNTERDMVLEMKMSSIITYMNIVINNQNLEEASKAFVLIKRQKENRNKELF